MSCVFCDIISRQAPARVVHETDQVIVFCDLHPCATHHYLVVPKQHVTGLMDLSAESGLWYALMAAVQQVVRQQNLKGFRLVVNDGPSAGQTVPHLHIHLLSGRYKDKPH